MKRSKILLVSGIVGALYMIYIIYHCVSSSSALNSADAAEAIGTGIGIALLIPHVVITVFAVIFNWLGWGFKLRWSALVGAILYCVAGAFMPIYIPYVLCQIVLSFIAFAKMKKKEIKEPEAEQVKA